MAQVKQTIEVIEWRPEADGGPRKVSEVEVEVDESTLMTEQEIDDFWCSCPPPPRGQHPDWDFHDDEWVTDPDTGEEYLDKHHYTCRACGKVTQIG